MSTSVTIKSEDKKAPNHRKLFVTLGILILGAVSAAVSLSVLYANKGRGVFYNPFADKDIAVWGKWIDQYNSKLTITNDAFDTQYSDYLSDPPTYTNPASRIAITFYDNDGTVANLGALGQTGFLVGQNAGGSFPDLWSRMDWHRDATGLKYCTTAYNAADEQTAMLQLVLHPASHDRANTTHGCGGFPFSVLTPRTGA